MPRVVWALLSGRPCLEIVLTRMPSGQPLPRTLLADTGAGSLSDAFQLLLTEKDCLDCGGFPYLIGSVGGAYAGSYPIYDLHVSIPTIGFQQRIRALAVPSAPPGVDGLACFGFLNQFTYGNFGDSSLFGLEC
jgi:hypothetical protein